MIHRHSVEFMLGSSKRITKQVLLEFLSDPDVPADARIEISQSDGQRETITTLRATWEVQT